MCVDAPPGSRSTHLWRRPAGLRPAFEVGDGDHRGALKFGSTAIITNGTKAYSVTSGYVATELTGDPIPGTDPLIMARNMRTTPQIIAVSEDGAVKIESGVVSDYSDSDLPQPNSVCFLDGFFVFTIGDGRMFATAINDTTVASSDYTTAEAKPDGLVRGVAAGRDLIAFGNSTTEFYANAGQETGFPFSRSAVIPIGLKGKYAVAGFEEGWTGPVGMVAADNTVRLITGYDAPIISSEALQRLIGAVTDANALRMDAYVADGAPILSLTHRGSPGWTWEFNVSKGRWHERESYGLDNWRGQFCINVFDKWLALDSESNAVFEIDPTFKREGANQMVWMVRSTQAHRFPGRAVIDRVSFDIRTGVGVATGADPIETKPVVAIRWSDDGGVTWSQPIMRSLGGQGNTVPIDIFRVGLTGREGRMWELTIADPVDAVLYGGAMNVTERAA